MDGNSENEEFKGTGYFSEQTRTAALAVHQKKPASGLSRVLTLYLKAVPNVQAVQSLHSVQIV
jgi:hypothetical protein